MTEPAITTTASIIRRMAPALIDSFADMLRKLEKSSATISKYRHDIEAFRLWLGDDDRVDKDRVILYKQDLKEKYKLSSANSMLSALNTFFKLLGWNECHVMTFKTQRATFRSEQKELSKEEYQRLLQAADTVKRRKQSGDPRLRLIMETIAGTGIRISELPFITVASLATRRATVTLKGKTREVLLPMELCKKLRAYCRERNITAGTIFVTRNGRPIDRTNIFRKMKALAAAADIPPAKIFPHNLRHLFAVNYYEAQKDIVRLADLLGHTNINTTRIYTLISCESQLSILDEVEQRLKVC